jgi:hypothetical protein
MDFGLSVFDANGIKTLGMEDFTLQKLAVMIVPAARGGGQGNNYEYIIMDVPGYDPATCFVTITPKVYAPYDQPGTPIHGAAYQLIVIWEGRGLRLLPK